MSAWLRSVLVACALAGFSGCGQESGILFAVGADQESPPPEDVDQLRFFAAYVQGDGMVQDLEVSNTTVSVKGRNLATSPYELLVKEDSHGGDPRKVSLAVIGYRNQVAVAFGILDDPPQPFVGGKIVLRRVLLAGFAEDAPFDVSETGCLRVGDRVFASHDDRDCDGFTSNGGPRDCNDENAKINPDATEVCANQLDDNCNTMVDEETDGDQDGVTNCGGDCDDGNPMVKPGAREICDGLDNDCDAKCDSEFDVDLDRHTTCGTKLDVNRVCTVQTPTESIEDCDDTRPTVFGGANEVCDGLDNDCDAKCDDGFDGDGDNYTTCGSDTFSCNGTMRTALTDCNDAVKEVNPGARELCNGRDDNCDGAFFPPHEMCFVSPLADECRVGQRDCDDSVGGAGYTTACTSEASSPAAPVLVCDSYSSCSSSPDPLQCTDQKLAMTANVRVLRCQVDFTANNSLCGATVETVTAPVNATQCTWGIFGGQVQGPYKVGFAAGGGVVTATATVCAPVFAVQEYMTPVGTTMPIGRRLFLTIDANGTSTMRTVYSVELIPNLVTTCGGDGMRCQMLAP